MFKNIVEPPMNS